MKIHFRSSAQKVAASYPPTTLMQIIKSLESEILAAMESGRQGTISDFGKIEMMTACAGELDRRGRVTGTDNPRFGRLRDGSDMPIDIAWIMEYGLKQKLSNSIRCF